MERSHDLQNIGRYESEQMNTESIAERFKDAKALVLDVVTLPLRSPAALFGAIRSGWNGIEKPQNPVVAAAVVVGFEAFKAGIGATALIVSSPGEALLWAAGTSLAMTAGTAASVFPVGQDIMPRTAARNARLQPSLAT